MRELVERLPKFNEKLQASGMGPLRPGAIEVLQINVGKVCNQTCKHCHVDAGPTRKESMTRSTFEECLRVLKTSAIPTVDLTGGAPELNPHFEWFVREVRALGRKAMVRCNLTVILSNPKYRRLPEFFAENQVQVISSLPSVHGKTTDRQRGQGVFEKSIEALKMLNAVGYGKPESGLILDLVTNPNGAFLPNSQNDQEAEFKKDLKEKYGIVFNRLFTITNMPISRFLEFLVQSGNLEMYMERLVSSFNAKAAEGVMCLNTVSVGWDGTLYDCDFNQMLDMQVQVEERFRNISQWNPNAMKERKIAVGQHCFGCTAGAGSSCGGQLT